MNEKLQKVMAAEGLGSRREMERLIDAGQVRVNGSVAKLGERVSAGDRVELGNSRFVVPEAAQKEIRVLLYNKPEGEICSHKDPEGRRSVFDRLPSVRSGRWISIGRLDFNTSGLLLFTDNGELANRLMHPSYNIDREYLVRLQGDVTEEIIEQLTEGVLLEDGVAKFTDIKEGGGKEKSSNRWYYCSLMEGKNREVRRLWESQELRVSRLKRVRYGPIFIPSFVRQGQWVELEDKDIAVLCKTVDLPVPPKRKLSKSQLGAKQRQEKRMRKAGAKNKKANKLGRR